MTQLCVHTTYSPHPHIIIEISYRCQNICIHIYFEWTFYYMTISLLFNCLLLYKKYEKLY